MARKIKFALELKNGYMARSNVDEIRDNFDAERIIEYFHDGRLETWLRDHFAADIAEKVSQLDKGDADILAKLCDALGVEQDEAAALDLNIDSQAIIERQSKEQRLRQHTDSEKLLKMADNAAFSQADLDRLISDGAKDIVLCSGRFTIPLIETKRHYYGAGRVVAVINSQTVVDFDALGIRFDGIAFDERYEKLISAQKELPQKHYDQAQAYEDSGNYGAATEEYRKAFELGNRDALEPLLDLYEQQDMKKERLQLLMAESNAGNSDCMTQLASALLEMADEYGRDDYARQGINWCEKAVGLGNRDAMYLLARIYFKGTYVEKDEKAAFKWYKKSAEAGKVAGMGFLALCYECGYGVDVDIMKAIEWYEKALEAEAVFIPFMVSLGGCLEKVGRLEDAVEWYLKAADAGNGEAMNSLGLMYSRGHGVAENGYEAFEWFRKSADAGYAWGMNNLAFCYMRGNGTTENAREARRWYEKAAEQGIVSAMTRMGAYCKEEYRYNEAKEWYEKAAEEGDGEAMNALGLLYDSGDGVRQSAKEAFRWFKKSANSGYAWGMYNLAQCYEDGSGVRADYNLAWEWYSKAADEGLEAAEEWFKKQKSSLATTPDALAELLGVLVRGKLKNGQQLWRGARSSKYYWILYIPREDIQADRSPISYWTAIRDWIMNDGETVIGHSEEANLIADNGAIVFTDQCFYMKDRDGNSYRRGYAYIKDVYSSSRTGLQIIYADGDTFYLPNSDEWDKRVGLESIRLFLLIAAKLLGEYCDYQFTDEEVNLLRLVRLEALDNECILEYLR